MWAAEVAVVQSPLDDAVENNSKVKIYCHQFLIEKLVQPKPPIFEKKRH